MGPKREEKERKRMEKRREEKRERIHSSLADIQFVKGQLMIRGIWKS